MPVVKNVATLGESTPAINYRYNLSQTQPNNYFRSKQLGEAHKKTQPNSNRPLRGCVVIPDWRLQTSFIENYSM